MWVSQGIRNSLLSTSKSKGPWIAGLQGLGLKVPDGMLDRRAVLGLAGVKGQPFHQRALAHKCLCATLKTSLAS